MCREVSMRECQILFCVCELPEHELLIQISNEVSSHESTTSVCWELSTVITVRLPICLSNATRPRHAKFTYLP